MLSADTQRTLDALTGHIAVLDASGKIIAINRRWREFGIANGLKDSDGCMGWNYISLCREQGRRLRYLAKLADALNDIGAGKRETYAFEYPCHSPEEKRWFITRASLLRTGSENLVLVVHDNITERVVAESQVKRLNRSLEDDVRRRTAELQRQVEVAEGLALQLIEAEQRERAMLAADLHDELAQLLAVALLNLSQLSKEQPESDALKTTEKVIRDAMSYTRSLIGELKPHIMGDLQFNGAVEWVAEQMGKRGLRIGVQASPETQQLRESVGVFLLRAIRELLMNVIKHASATEAWVQIRWQPDALKVVVIDDGVGLQRRSTPDGVSGGFGLRHLQDRLDPLRGTFDLEPNEEGGTRATVTLPLWSATIAEKSGAPAREVAAWVSLRS